MNSSSNDPFLARCQRLGESYVALLRRHLYLKEQLTSIQHKILSSSSGSPEALALIDGELAAVSQRLKELADDPWLDKLFSVAQNESQVREIESLMLRWGQGSYDSVAHCIVNHANRHGYPGDYLKYLRKAANFNKKRSRKSSREPGVYRWNRRNDEYLLGDTEKLFHTV
jgi:hypothetical protein